MTLEDALSGEVLWEREAPFVAPDDLWACQADGDEPAIALDPVRAWATESLIVIEGCGVSATFDAAGTRLDDPASPDDQVDPLGDGTTRRFDPTTTRSTVLDRAGAPLWEVTGQILTPHATDGTADDIIVVNTLSGVGAFAPDGTELWESPLPASTLFAHTGGALVLDDGANGLVALDPTTGRQTWSVPGAESNHPFGASTDGAQVIVHSRTNDGAAWSVGHDLVSGDVLWRDEARQDIGLIGYRGALLRLSENSLGRLG